MILRDLKEGDEIEIFLNDIWQTSIFLFFDKHKRAFVPMDSYETISYNEGASYVVASYPPDKWRLPFFKKYIPFDITDKLVGKQVKTKIKTDITALIISQDNTDIILGNLNLYSYEKLFNQFLFIDGTPCGKIIILD